MPPIDPDMFLNHGTEGAFDDHFTPVDAGEYEAMVSEIKPRVFLDRNNITRAACDIWWKITDQTKLAAQQARTGMQEPRVKQGLFLDAEFARDENDELVITALQSGPGKNVQLGQLRTALGQNDPKRKWSFRSMIGALAKITVEHVPDEKDPENVYAQVAKKGVTAI